MRPNCLEYKDYYKNDNDFWNVHCCFCCPDIIKDWKVIRFYLWTTYHTFLKSSQVMFNLFWTKFDDNILVIKMVSLRIKLCLNRSWRISSHNSQHNQNFLIIFKQSIMVILSCLAKKNQNLNSRKKSSVYYWNWVFKPETPTNLPFQ